MPFKAKKNNNTQQRHSLFSKFIFGCSRSSLVHGLFSSCGERGLLSSCGVWASHCGGLSLQSMGSRVHGLHYLQHVGSVVAASGL